MIVAVGISFAITAKEISIAAIIISIIVGAVVGRILGYFVKRKLSNVKCKTRNVLYDFYSSYLKVVDQYSKKLKLDVNSNRIILEAVNSNNHQTIDRFRLPLYLAKDSNNEFFQLLCKLEKVLSSPQGIQAMNLSWKLFLIECQTLIKQQNLPA